MKHNTILYILLTVGALALAVGGVVGIVFFFVNTPENQLVYAAEGGDIATTKSLLAQGVDVNAQDSEIHETALMFAIDNHHFDVALLLIDKGADVNAKDPKGNTALIEAAMKGEANTVEALLHHNADVNAQNDYAETPLSDAVINGHTDVVKILLDHRANANWKYIADPEADGKTLLEEAKDQKSYDIVALLRKAGAK